MTGHAHPYCDTLTDRQREVLQVIRRLHRETGVGPTIRELCVACSITSTTNGVADVIRKLRHCGYLLPARPGTARSIVPVLTDEDPEADSGPARVGMCSRCHGTGRRSSVTLCLSCLGYGWTWLDGVPPTLCPGGGVAPKIEHERMTKVPCGRRGATCPGCDRARTAIGTDEDRARTLQARL
jgi:SOS-response transcriptional repressor LexA